jgi:signal transduction histidine kinase
MSSAPKGNVQAQLTLAILAVLFLSYILSSATSYYFMRQDFRRWRQLAMAQNPSEARRLPPEPAWGLWDFLIGPPTPGHRRRLSRNHDRDGVQPTSRPATPPPAPKQSLVEVISERKPALFRFLFALLLAVGTGAWLSRLYTRPLNALAQGAQAFHAGNLEHRIPAAGSNEFAEVARTMNDMADRVAAQLNALEEDARRRQQLLADIAHELRGPVTTLRTMAGAMDEGLADDPERRARAVSLMLTTSDRMLHLVTDLLELAKLDLHELPLHPQAVDVAALLTVVVQAHQEAAAAHAVTLLDVPAGPPVTLTVDPNRFAQVMDNLLDNAISHAGAEAKVTVTVSQDIATRIVVADTGKGIPAEHLPFIFDPFYRVDHARSPKDNHSGLGLRIARALIEAQGGTLTLQSVEGQGTQAIIEFPPQA